ncbi:hypothetical protein T552_00122 [Pneumocystis carinii B80]|uniref:LIM zinc-binding domain-containing protein n=1 Tax=Pneumocystis carinii (strain B80) TaxID=1408658 RepID=A0A0W4ZSW7_PNEC8|nr:hypothetical protein T552_00122 [Pneumocystis carinii B80]KTW31479.1 hypothetical protein T552_00122 [Pneumocystis carinii B80]
MEECNSSKNYDKKLSEISLNIAFDTESKENSKSCEEKTFTAENSLMNNMNFFQKPQEKSIPWLCSLCCETFPSDELMYKTTERQEAYYCKNCHFHLSSKNKDIYPNEINNNNTASQHQDKNPQESLSENNPSSIENLDEVSLKDSIKNNCPIINNLTPKVNISQACTPVSQGSMKNSEMWELLRKKKRNSLGVRKHLENFVESKRLHNSFNTNTIDISPELSSFRDKVEKETLESKISSITLSEEKTNISQENIPPILPSTRNYKHKLFLPNHVKSKNNALSTIDYNSFSEKDTFSRCLKDSSNDDKQQQFLSNSISPKKVLTSNTIPNLEPLKNNSAGIFSVKKKPLPKFGGFDRCASCNESITFLESYPGPNSTRWHKKCLKCSGGCGKNMDSGSLNEIDKDGKMKVYCRFCWDTIKKGKKPVTISLVMSNTLQDFSTLEENRT